MTSKALTDLRLRTQRIGGAGLSVHELAHFMGATQAQDYYGALWSIGLRTGRTEEEVIAAIEKNEIIRTWPQRGTLHFVAAEDAKWMVDLSAPRLIAGAKKRHADLGLDDITLQRSKTLFEAALRGGNRLTRPQMMELLEREGIATEKGRGYHMLWFAAQTGLIYIGPMVGKQQSFGLLDELPVAAKKLSREESVIELTGRYFHSHGPATLADFVGWSGLTITQAKAGLEVVKEELVAEGFDGTNYWHSRQEPSAKKAPSIALLPGFDEYILGYKDRTAQLKAERFQRVTPGGNGMFMSTVVRQGQVVGLWRRALKKSQVVVTAEAFDAFTKQDVATIEKAAQKYADFFGLKLEMG